MPEVSGPIPAARLTAGIPRGPSDDHDAHGKLAEDALLGALVQRRAAGDSEITLDTRIITLVDQHIEHLAEDGRSIRTIDTYQCCSKLLAKIIAGVRVWPTFWTAP